MFSVRRLRWTKLRKSDGAAMVEFAIGSTVLIMFVLGIIEFGFLWYQKQVITNATREGARYGVTYQTTTAGLRRAPKNLSPSIATVVNNYCSNRIPAGSWTIAALGGTAASANDGDELHTPLPLGSPPKTIIVRVNCTNKMDLLSGLIPSLANITFSAQSIMNCE